MTEQKNIEEQQPQQQMRGVIIESNGTQYRMRLEGVPPLEALSLVSIIKNKLEKDLGA